MASCQINSIPSTVHSSYSLYRILQIFGFSLVTLTCLCHEQYDEYPSVTYKKDRSNPILPFKWCTWSSWSRCAPEPCKNGVSIQPSRIDQQGDGGGEQDELYYCVIPSISSHSASSSQPIKVERIDSDGQPTSLVAMKMRHRWCKCYYLSAKFLFGRNKDKCKGDTIEESCTLCTGTEIIYSHRTGSDAPLPLCPEEVPNLQLYRLIGGLAGSVVFLLALIWLIRVLCQTFSSSRSRTVQRLRSAITRYSSDRIPNIVAPLRTQGSTELPPLYKDVVASDPPKPDLPKSSYSTKSDSSDETSAVPLTPSATATAPDRDDSPPPPSYSYVMGDTTGVCLLPSHTNTTMTTRSPNINV